MTYLKRFSVLPLVLFCFILNPNSQAQTVNVGAGSYSTVLGSGDVGVQNANGVVISPRVTSGFDQPIQSNDYWSSLIYPFYAVPHSNVMYAHPVYAKTVSEGLELGHTVDPAFAAADYLFPFRRQLTIGISGLSASTSKTDSYGDWTVTALWQDGSISMKATLGHGLPYVFFEMEGGNAVISTNTNPTIWFNQAEVMGITVDGIHYGLFAPAGSSWSGSSTLQSALNGKGFLSVAILPDNSQTTLEQFRERAYAFVTDSRVEWTYDEASSEVLTTYTYDTILMDSTEGNLDETLTALYRHQWLNTANPLTQHSYKSPNGEMKLLEGSTFSTTHPFDGVLPALPDQGDYNKDDLLAYVQDAANDVLAVEDTYNNGKKMARFANLVHIAEQLGATTERDYFLAQMKSRLEDWFTAGGSQQYVYNNNWDVLTGYPSSFGADNQINDHHFHSSYAIQSAATIAMYDSAWASQENWGAMVNMLIKNANNWDRNDTMFPFLRSHDAYAGHSWAAGHGDFGDGNNQESSSESMNFASAVVLWGEVTGQDEVRDLGVYLHATEASAVDQYWFDVDDVVFPENYPHVAIGMVWGGKGVHSTWFGADPEFIHGINILPVTSGSFYLGRHPDYVLANYNEIVDERNGQPVVWKDVLWQYLALSDPNQAIGYYLADPNYEVFDGESRAHTLHWLFNMKKMGHVDFSVSADIPTNSVFITEAGDKTYIAYNADDTDRLVTFSDGFTMMVPAGEMKTESTIQGNPNAPVALMVADKTSGKLPLTVNFEGSKSFDRNEGNLSYAWDFAGLGNSSAVDTSFTFGEEGEFKVILTVTNDLELVSQDSITIEVLGNGTPFFGDPAQVPGTVQAEHYDKGGEGVAYHDTEADNIGLAFRPDEGVDIQGVAGGFAVYWITAGEWIEYTISATEEGIYDIIPYAATVPGFGNFRIFIDGQDVSGKINVTGTGGWEFWTAFPVRDVKLSAGTHIMRFEFDTDNQSQREDWLFSLDRTQLNRVGSVSNEEESDIPQEVELLQNYPNPFNPTTNISFSLPAVSEVNLSVFNLLGQKVSEIHNGRLNAGEHTFNFDASNLSSGIYIYNLTTDKVSITKKMILIK